jgi:hypothetical protein
MPRIPFAKVTFPRQELPERYEVENRLKRFLANYRKKFGTIDSSYAVTDTDRDTIKRRAAAYFAAVGRASGMGHLDRTDREVLEVFRGGVELVAVKTEHRADEIASALHSEMPWMSSATERIWQDMRSSVRRGDLAPRISPLLLVGPPGIGKSHWARLLGDLMRVPTTVIEATNESASFAVAGTQRGWSSCSPGRPLQTIIAQRIANPVLVIDEIEKAGSSVSTKGQSYELSQGLLPLLERLTAQSWSCPYYRVQFDMSWITWVLTANTVNGLSEPFLSRCPPTELRALTQEHLFGFADREGSRRDLPSDAIDAVKEVIMAIKTPHHVSLRSVIRMLDAVEQTMNRPVLH